jgi:two-component system, NtrC family, response regulator
MFVMSIPKPSFHQIISTAGRPPAPSLPVLRTVRARYLAEVERLYLTELMRCTTGDVMAACRISGLSRSRLYALLHKHDLHRHL